MPSLQETVLFIRNECQIPPPPDWDGIVDYLLSRGLDDPPQTFTSLRGLAAEVYLWQVIDSIKTATIDWEVAHNGSERYRRLSHYDRAAKIDDSQEGVVLETDALFLANGYVFAGEAKSSKGVGYLRRQHAQKVLRGFHEFFAPHQEYVPWLLFAPPDSLARGENHKLCEEAERDGHIVIPMGIEQGTFEVGLECMCGEVGMPFIMNLQTSF